MKHRMRECGVDALVIPNGVTADAFIPPHPEAVTALRRRFADRLLLTKVARWDPDKRWMMAIGIVALLKQEGWRPLLVARGGIEPYGGEVLWEAACAGLRVVERPSGQGASGMLEALSELSDADIVVLRSTVDPQARGMLFQGAAAVLANSAHEPFGLVGLETMAAGGLACTGISGEDYAIPGHNALVLQTADPEEFLSQFSRLRNRPDSESAIRTQGRMTAERYMWPDIIQRNILPRASHCLFSRRRNRPDSESAIRKQGRMTAELYMWPDIIERNLAPRASNWFGADSPAHQRREFAAAH